MKLKLSSVATLFALLAAQGANADSYESPTVLIAPDAPPAKLPSTDG